MALIDGARGFDARVNAGTALALPYSKLKTDTVRIYKGQPVILNSGGSANTQIVSLAAVTASGVVGAYVNSAKILGFAAHDDDSDLPRQFAVLPKITRPDGNYEQIVYVGDRITRFSMAVTSGQVASAANTGKACDIRVEKVDPTTGQPIQVALDPSSSTYGQVYIVGVKPGDEGKLGGVQDFVLSPAKSQYVSES